MTAPEPQLRAYRFALDLTAEQETRCRQHAGAARWAYNHALAAKFAALDARRAVVADRTAAGDDPKTAGAHAPKIPTKPTIQKNLNQVKGDSRAGIDGLCPWFHEVSTYAFQSAFADADTAWKNWTDSITGRRGGRPVKRPRYKTKHRSRDSFRIHHDVTHPTIRLDTGYRRIIVPRFGSLRTKSCCSAPGFAASAKKRTTLCTTYFRPAEPPHCRRWTSCTSPLKRNRFPTRSAFAARWTGRSPTFDAQGRLRLRAGVRTLRRTTMTTTPDRAAATVRAQ